MGLEQKRFIAAASSRKEAIKMLLFCMHPGETRSSTGQLTTCQAGFAIECHSNAPLHTADEANDDHEFRSDHQLIVQAPGRAALAICGSTDSWVTPLQPVGSQAQPRSAAELANAHEEILQLRSQMAGLSEAAKQSEKVRLGCSVSRAAAQGPSTH